MKNKLTIVFILMLNGIAFSGTEEQFPLDKLKINMSVEEYTNYEL